MFFFLFSDCAAHVRAVTIECGVKIAVVGELYAARCRSGEK